MRDPYGTPADAPWVVGDFLREKGRRNGDKVAVEVAGATRTYAELDRCSDRIAAGLHRLGLSRGDRACLMMDNSAENLDTWFGMCKAGIVEVPINTANRGYLLQYIVAQSDARAIVCDEAYLPRLAQVADELPLLEHVVVRRTSTGPLEAQLPSRIARHDLADLALDEEPPRPDLTPADTAVILYTSGTTGASKGVALPHAMNLITARHVAWLARYTSEDLLYTVFPLFHINAKYTSVMAAMAADASLVMDTRFSASGFFDTCRSRGITAFNYQGALLTMLMKQPERDDDADNPVRVAFGAPAPVEIWEAFEARFGLRLIEVYGMTETATSLQNTLDDTRIGSCGKPVPHFEVEIHDEHDQPCPPGVPGEIVVRPRYPDVMIREYHGMPDVTLHAFRNLWFHTGDRAKSDDDGYVYFLDRMKDAIRRRGENISSFEVERVINTHDAVLESAAYGVPSELAEEEVMTAVVVKPGRELSGVELLDFCQERMAHFAVPRYVRFVPELPKTPSQRIQKYKLRDEAVTADTWDRDAHGYEVRRG
jgi:crotonobetaine/carnitine-CoA ligase